MPPDRPPFPGTARGAFTLIELLVAMSITILLVGIMVGLTANVLTIWNEQTGRVAVDNQAAVIMDLIGEDLRSAILRRDGRVWLAATIQNTQATVGDAGGVGLGSAGTSSVSLALWTASNGGMIKPANTGTDPAGSSLVLPPYTAPTTATLAGTASFSPDLTTYRFGQAGVWLRLFTTAPGVNDPDVSHASAPRAVSYQIIRMKLTSTSPDYGYYLFRSVVRPFAATNSGLGQDQSTFNSGYDFFYNLTLSSPNTNHNLNSPADYNNVTQGGTAQEAAGNIRRPNLQQLLGNNIIDFGVRFWGQAYDAGGKPMNVLLFPASSNAAVPNLGFAATTEDGLLRHDDTTGALLPGLQPPAVSGWTTGGLMTWAYSFRSNGGSGVPDKSATPLFADIFLRILDEEGARLIQALEAGTIKPPANTTPDDYWWTTALAHSSIYTRRVPLQAAPL